MFFESGSVYFFGRHKLSHLPVTGLALAVVGLYGCNRCNTQNTIFGMGSRTDFCLRKNDGRAAKQRVREV
jgi:hypothetical protein